MRNGGDFDIHERLQSSAPGSGVQAGGSSSGAGPETAYLDFTAACDFS